MGEEEDVEAVDVLAADALGGPRAVVVVAVDADVTFIAMIPIARAKPHLARVAIIARIAPNPRPVFSIIRGRHQARVEHRC